MWQELDILIATKLNSNCDKILKPKLWQNSTKMLTKCDQTRVARKLNNLSCDKIPKLKPWQNLKTQIGTNKNSTCDNTKTLIVTKLKLKMWQIKNSNCDKIYIYLATKLNSSSEKMQKF